MTPNMTKYVIYIDTGGTFTDCCAVTLDGEVIHGKAHTTSHDLSICFFNAIDAAAQKLGKSVEEVLNQCQLVGYGTTQGTNVVVTGTGAPNLGLITTMGHEDRTLIGRLRTAGLTPVETMHLVTADTAPPLIPRQRIRGVIERIDQMDNRAALIAKNVFDALTAKKTHDIIGKFHLNVPSRVPEAWG